MKTKLLAFFILASACFLLAETVPQTQTTLKSYFNPTGAIPTTNDYNELIDTTFFYINSMWTNSQAAAASAASAASAAPAVVAVGWMETVTTQAWTLSRNVNVSNVIFGPLVGSAYYPTTILFSNYMAGTNYGVWLSSDSVNIGLVNSGALVKSNWCMVVELTNNIHNKPFSLLIYQ